MLRGGRVRTSPDDGGAVAEIVEPSPCAAAERLIADLNWLRRDSGNPSLGQLVKLSERKPSKSTLDDHLAGRRTRLPPWRLVSAYVSACHAAAGSTGLDVERLGTLEEWHTRWVAASKGVLDAASPIRKPASVASRTVSLADVAGLEALSGQPPRSDSTEVGQPKPAGASISPILHRLEGDLSALEKSLSPYTALLLVTSGSTVGTRFSVEHNITTIGRDPESDIWLNEPTVSRLHAVIHRYGDRFVVRDTESHNGTFVGRQRISEETVLISHEELNIASFRLLFVQGGESAKKLDRQQRYHRIRSDLIDEIGADTSAIGTTHRVQRESGAPDGPKQGRFDRHNLWGRRKT